MDNYRPTPGDVVIAGITARKYGFDTPKRRPAVVLGVRDGRVHLMGLTSLATFSDGKRRRPYTKGPRDGLREGNDIYLWGSRPITIPPSAISHWLGRISPESAHDIANLAGDNLEAGMARTFLGEVCGYDR